MSRFDHLDDVPVPIGECLCPGTPHPDGDVVYLSPALSAAGGMAAQGAIADAESDSIRLQELLWRVYRDHGVVGWNLLDEDGEPVPLTQANKETGLPYGKGGRLVGDAADSLYVDDVLAPFKERLERLRRSQPGPTSAGRKATSSTRSSTRKPPKPSSTPATELAPLEE